MRKRWRPPSAPNAALKPALAPRRVVPASYAGSGAPKGFRKGARPLVKPRVISAPPTADDGFRRRQVVSASERDVRVVSGPDGSEAAGPRLLRRAAQSAPALP
ncbi:unnamed protein product, partial [Symbiodinium natans]